MLKRIAAFLWCLIVTPLEVMCYHQERPIGINLIAIGVLYQFQQLLHLWIPLALGLKRFHVRYAEVPAAWDWIFAVQVRPTLEQEKVLKVQWLFPFPMIGQAGWHGARRMVGGVADVDATA